MRKIIFLLLTFCMVNSFGQGSDLLVQFKATQRANEFLGRDFSVIDDYTALPNPLDIEFDGEKLTIRRANRDVWAEWDVISWEHKENVGNQSFLEKEVYILKIEEYEYMLYYVIEILRDKQEIDDTIFTLKRPTIGDDGIISGYMHFQQF